VFVGRWSLGLANQVKSSQVNQANQVQSTREVEDKNTTPQSELVHGFSSMSSGNKKLRFGPQNPDAGSMRVGISSDSNLSAGSCDIKWGGEVKRWGSACTEIAVEHEDEKEMW